jgi:hypothetical protein
VHAFVAQFRLHLTLAIDSPHVEERLSAVYEAALGRADLVGQEGAGEEMGLPNRPNLVRNNPGLPCDLGEMLPQASVLSNRTSALPTKHGCYLVLPETKGRQRRSQTFRSEERTGI